MTKFEELQEIITRNKNKGKNDNNCELDNDSLEVAGSEGTKKPLISCGDDETDPDLLDQLRFKAKYRPNDGSNAASWDATWD